MSVSVLEPVRNTRSPDRDTREEAEKTLTQSLHADPDGHAQQLVALCLDEALDASDRQSALVVLRTAITHSWSIGLQEFSTDRAMSPAVKDQVRRDLLVLLGSQSRRIRSLAALTVSRIMSVDYPSEWPEALPTLVAEASQESSPRLLGYLVALSEILNNVFSEQDFYREGPAVLEALLRVVSGNYNVLAKTEAVRCFNSCVQYCFIARGSDAVGEDELDEDEDEEEKVSMPTPVEHFVREMVGRWMQAFCWLVQQHQAPSPRDAATLNLKVEIMSSVLEMAQVFADLLVPHFTDLFAVIGADLTATEPAYYQLYVQGTSLDEYPANQDCIEANQELLAGVGLVELVERELAVLGLCVRSRNGARQSLVRDAAGLGRIVHILVRYMQLPAAYDDESLDEFVSDQLETTVEDTPRNQAIDMASSLASSPEFVVVALQQTRELVLSDSPWTVEEAALLLMGLVSENSGAGSEVLMTALSRVADYLHKPVLAGRSLITASRISASETCWEGSFQLALAPESSRLLRASALFAVRNILQADEISHQVKASRQKDILHVVAILAAEADGDTPSFLLEMLGRALNLDYAAACTATGVVGLLLQLAAMDASNVELVAIASEVFGDLVQHATSLGQYDCIASQCWEPLLQGLQTTTRVDYNPDLQLVLTLIVSVLEHGPDPLPSAVMDNMVQPLHDLIQATSDSQVLQEASNALGLLVDRSGDQLVQWSTADNTPGITLVLDALSIVMNHSLTGEESAAIHAGRLVSVLLNRFGSHVPTGLIGELLRATMMRMASAKTLLLIESLVTVFLELLLRSAGETVDLLASAEMNVDGTSGLQIVLTKWLENFDVVRGFEAIRRNVQALQALFELNDSRVSDITVEDGVVAPEEGVILTRSRAKNLPRAQVPVPVKILKLFVREVAAAHKSSVRATKLAVAVDADDGWEDFGDDLDDDGDDRIVALIGDWLQKIRTSHANLLVQYGQQLTRDETQTLQSVL